MNTIDLPMLLMLLDCNSPTYCWLSDCTMNDDGIKIRIPLTEEDGIGGNEWMRQKLYEQEIQLDLPCTIKQFVDWAVLNHYDYILPTNDEELAEYAERNCFFSELPANLLREIKSALTPSEVNNQSDIRIDDKPKPKRKLKPMKRATTESLQLIYAMTTAYGVEYEDELTGSSAWGLVVCEKFPSDLIKTKPENNRDNLVFNDGEKITKSEFIKKWNERFE